MAPANKKKYFFRFIFDRFLDRFFQYFFERYFDIFFDRYFGRCLTDILDRFFDIQKFFLPIIANPSPREINIFMQSGEFNFILISVGHAIEFLLTS